MGVLEDLRTVLLVCHKHVLREFHPGAQSLRRRIQSQWLRLKRWSLLVDCWNGVCHLFNASYVPSSSFPALRQVTPVSPNAPAPLRQSLQSFDIVLRSLMIRRRRSSLIFPLRSTPVPPVSHHNRLSALRLPPSKVKNNLQPWGRWVVWRLFRLAESQWLTAVFSTPCYSAYTRFTSRSSTYIARTCTM